MDEQRTVATIVQRPRDDVPHGHRYTLLVTAGPDKGLRFVVDGTTPGRVLVGQSASCSVRLSDREVSRRHFALEPTDDGLRLTDLGSTNGTYVDRVKVVEAELAGEEMIRVGQTVFGVTREDEELVTPAGVDRFGGMLGASAEMRRLYPLCERLARATIPVVIEGETGTGKEVLAEALHEQGPRASCPFVVFDCTAVPASLVESELFGHERGAFTGAVSSRPGVFEQADGGTLFIDEIGDLDLPLQPKLLRAIERSEVRRVGGDRWVKVDVRVLAATRRNLDAEVEAGRFRDDLFHRLAVARVELPPLRHRKGDVRLLAAAFLAELGAQGTVPEALLLQWERDPWPGNVRELRNAVARRVALGDVAISSPTTTSDALAGGDLVEQLLAARVPFTSARDRVLEDFERRFVERLVDEHGGDIGAAATASGIGRRYFQKLRARSR